MKCVGIIWNCAFEFRFGIMEIVSRYANLRGWYCIDLHQDYEALVRKIYEPDTIAEWKVNKKVEFMKLYQSTSVCVVLFDIDTSITRYHEKKKHLVYANLQDLKDLIRDTYNSKIPFYFFDIIFHCSETEEEYKSDIQTFDSFINL